MITLKGTYYLESRKYVNYPFTPDWQQIAAYQIKSALYLCGGQKWALTGTVFLHNLLTKDQEGEVWEGLPMDVRRSCVGLSGVTNELGAVGGINSTGILSDFETYSLIQDKWSLRAGLNEQR